MSKADQLIIIQAIIMLLLFTVIVLLIRQNIAIKYERRIGRYSIEPINDHSKSFFDIAYARYLNLIIDLRPFMLKLKIFNKPAERYSKYITYAEKNTKQPIDYITNKIVIGIAFILFTIFSQVLQVRVLTLFELLINFLIGFFILDIYLVYRQKSRIKKIKNDILKAVIIMNNAFKSGKSTMQAVEIASQELAEPINDEFKKIYMDMRYGLSIDTVFERFSKRVKIDEVKYLSSSLTILNKTGGNIVKVFNSIEKTLFDKKKLQEELKNLTVSTNMIVKVLLFIPFIFVGVIYLLNPNYFDPLFATPIGFLVLGFMIITFAAYVFFLQNIMKVKV